MGKLVLLAYEYLERNRCAKTEEIARYVAEKLGIEKTLQLHKDLYKALQSLVKSGTVKRIAHGHYCINK
jgi:ribosomal protein L19